MDQGGIEREEQPCQTCVCFAPLYWPNRKRERWRRREGAWWKRDKDRRGQKYRINTQREENGVKILQIILLSEAFPCQKWFGVKAELITDFVFNYKQCLRIQGSSRWLFCHIPSNSVLCSGTETSAENSFGLPSCKLSSCMHNAIDSAQGLSHHCFPPHYVEFRLRYCIHDSPFMSSLFSHWLKLDEGFLCYPLHDRDIFIQSMFKDALNDVDDDFVKLFIRMACVLFWCGYWILFWRFVYCNQWISLCEGTWWYLYPNV